MWLVGYILWVPEHLRYTLGTRVSTIYSGYPSVYCILWEPEYLLHTLGTRVSTRVLLNENNLVPGSPRMLWSSSWFLILCCCCCCCREHAVRGCFPRRDKAKIFVFTICPRVYALCDVHTACNFSCLMLFSGVPIIFEPVW